MAQQAPLTQTQLPLEAILDIFGKQTYLGNAWTLPATGTALTDTSEHPIAYIANAATNTKGIFLYNQHFLSDANATILRFYFNPTVNVAGSATAAKNLRSGSTATSIATCYLGATFSANGTLLSTISTSTAGSTSELMYVIDPGKGFLITGQQITGSVGTSNIYLQAAWYEI